MRPDGLRFSPPPFALTTAIRWVLRRAFGPPQEAFPGPVDGAEAARLAVELSLVERIGARVPSSSLVDELGRDAALGLAVSRLRVVARMKGLCALIPELASLAAAEAVPLALVKFAALHVGGYVAEGSRSAGDIDVLLRPADARRASELLRGRGFRVVEMMTADHHLPPLQDERGRVVELHTHLPGLKGPGARRFASFDALRDAGGLEPAPGLGEGCHLLRRELLAAHLVAHGLAHHGGADFYPVTRALADVIDLLPAGRAAAAGAVREWIADDVPAAELEAVVRLCDALESGDLDDVDTERGTRPEEALLRHVLAGALDAEYRSSLAVAHVLHPLTDEPRWWKVLKTVGRAAFPTGAQLAVRSGVPSGRMSGLRLRLTHATAFARRVSRLAMSTVRRATGG